jgi:hypothetical protein
VIVTVVGQSRWRLRAVQALLLVPRTARTIRWVALVGGTVLGFVFIHRTARGASVDVAQQILAVRVAAVALCLGGAFALDDPASETLEGAPAAATFQRSLRIAVFLPVLVAAWIVLLAYTNSGRGDLPLPALTLEFGAMVTVTWAAAAAATPRVPDGLGGIAAGPALLGFVAVGALVHQLALFSGEQGDAAWAAAHRRWMWALLIALGILAQASRDAARARWGRRAVASLRDVTRRREDPDRSAWIERPMNRSRSVPRQLSKSGKPGGGNDG